MSRRNTLFNKFPLSRGLNILKASINNRNARNQSPTKTPVAYVFPVPQGCTNSERSYHRGQQSPSADNYENSTPSESDLSEEDGHDSDVTYVPNPSDNDTASTTASLLSSVNDLDDFNNISNTDNSDHFSALDFDNVNDINVNDINVNDMNDIILETDESDDDQKSNIFPALSVTTTGVTVDKCKGKNKWDKKHSCTYCLKHVVKMSSHLQAVHADEPEVAAILKLPKKSKERRDAFVRLLNDGDFKHNYEVLKSHSGFLIPKYRKAKRNVDDLVACQFCKAMYKKSLLSKHLHKCSENPRRNVCLKWGEGSRMGEMMLPVEEEKKSAFFANVTARMRKDDVSRLVLADSLIILFGQRLYGRKDVEECTANHVSGRLRELGRLMKIIREKSSMKVSTLKATLDPCNFDLVITCVRELAVFEESSHLFKKGELAKKIGHSLKTCSQILEAEAIKQNDDNLKVKAERFLTLIKAEWHDAISAVAVQSIVHARMNKVKLIPSLSDVEKVIKTIEKDIESEEYSVLTKAVLAYISVFNRKRGGELQRMKVEDFRVKQSTSSADAEVLAGLTATEKKLVHMLSRTEIRGKFNRPVPILLTPRMLSAVDRILALRKAKGIDSRYLFAPPTGLKPYRGPDVLRYYANEASVEYPSLFTSTNLRKQLATLSQAMEVSKMGQDQLAAFLGHDIRIHRNIYRLPIEVIQKAKVASILFKINRGVEVPDDIREDYLTAEEVEAEEAKNSSDDEGEEVKARSEKTKKGCDHRVVRPRQAEEMIVDNEVIPRQAEDLVVDNDAEEMEKSLDDESEEVKAKKTKKACVHRAVTPRQPEDMIVDDKAEEMENSSDDEGEEVKARSKKFKKACGQQGSRKQKCEKKPWTQEEIDAVEKHLAQCLQLHRIPQKYEAERARAASKALQHRTWKNIKYFVYNRLKKYKH